MWILYFLIMLIMLLSRLLHGFPRPRGHLSKLWKSRLFRAARRTYILCGMISWFKLWSSRSRLISDRSQHGQMFVRGCEMPDEPFLGTMNNSDNAILLKASLET
jgi:hypothetical protein